LRVSAILLAGAACGFSQGVLCQPAAAAAPAPAPTAECERPAGAPSWLPCGPDRVLNEADLKQYILKDGWTTRTQVKGGDSGKMYFMNLLPDGGMEAGMLGGQNIGKSWTLQGGKMCRNYYRVFTGPQCNTFELKAGVLYLVDADSSRNPLTAMEFVKK
jgi:hypothetical protein